MKKTAMEQLMLDCFHGSEEKDILSHMRMLVLAEEPYASMYDVVNTPVTNPCSTMADVKKLYLKPDLHQTEKQYLAGQHLTESVMERRCRIPNWSNIGVCSK